MVLKEQTEMTEEEYLDWYKNQDWPIYEKPSVTIDHAIFYYDKKETQVKTLLIKRKNHPSKDCWALPGGFVNPDESLEEAVCREVLEEVGLTIEPNLPVQLKTFSVPGRDPRGWVISTLFFTLLPQKEKPVANDDAKEAKWFNNKVLLQSEDGTTLTVHLDDTIEKESQLAFDHEEMLKTVIQKILRD